MDKNSEKCRDKNCFHRTGLGCADVLLHPELLLQNYTTKGSRGLSSSNPLLEFCLDGGCATKVAKESSSSVSVSSSSSILFHCSNSEELDVEMLENVCQSGCDINVQNYRGESALHVLINGLTKSNFPRVLSCLVTLIRYRIDLRLTDVNGDSALHVLIGKSSELTDEKYILFQLLINNGCDLNQINSNGRTVLTYSLENPEMTRFLINHGALIWPTNQRNHSAFTWFLKAVINRGSVSGFETVLNLLCLAMKLENHQRMRSHVTSTMIYLGRNAEVIGPIFKEVLGLVSPYWNRPLPLKYLCLLKIRKVLGPTKISGGALEHLHIPAKIRKYLLYQN